MKSDYLTYRRAANVSLFGLALQVLLGAGLLIFSVLTKDHAAASAAAFAGFAALGWLALAIVYDQHRRERIEAMEAESLAASQTAASVFDATDAEFRVAAKRLAGLHKVFLPTISLQIDYMGPARLGAWVQGHAQVLKTTRNMVFGQGLVTADGELAQRFNGIFKLGPAFTWDDENDPWGIR